MARSRESLWLWAGGSLVAGGAALVGSPEHLMPRTLVTACGTSTPMIGAYALVAVAIVCFVGAVRDWPFPFAAGQSDFQEPEQGGNRVADGEVASNSLGDTVSPNESAGQVIVGEIPREASAFVERQALILLSEAVGSGQVAVVCAVTGLRGVGKTQLAAAYARDRNRPRVPIGRVGKRRVTEQPAGRPCTGGGGRRCRRSER
jgi:hypothetical protein